MGPLIAGIVIIVLILLVLVNCIKIVPQAHAMVIERLGGYLTTWSVGLHFKVPFKGTVKGAGCRLPAAAGYHEG